MTKMNAEIDLRNVLPDVPSDAIDRSDDLCIKVRLAKEILEEIGAM